MGSVAAGEHLRPVLWKATLCLPPPWAGVGAHAVSLGRLLGVGDPCSLPTSFLPHGPRPSPHLTQQPGLAHRGPSGCKAAVLQEGRGLPLSGASWCHTALCSSFLLPRFHLPPQAQARSRPMMSPAGQPPSGPFMSGCSHGPRLTPPSGCSHLTGTWHSPPATSTLVAVLPPHSSPRSPRSLSRPSCPCGRQAGRATASRPPGS